MALALQITSLALTNGKANLTFKAGDPLPAQGDGRGFSIDVSGIDNMVAAMLDQLRTPDFALSLIILRAHNIDPTHGATFRNAVNGTTITFDPTTDNIITIAQ